MKPENTFYSYHIFLFPFTWDVKNIKSSNNADTFSDRHTLQHIRQLLATSDMLTLFEYKIERPSDAQEPYNPYNETQYFYEFTHDVLNYAKSTNMVDVLQYNAKLSDDAHYEISIKGQPTPYRLDLKSVCVNFYGSGVGVVAYFLENHNYREIADVLKINEYGRRVYPQFLGWDDAKGLTSDAKNYFLADTISVKYNGHTETLEDFEYYQSYRRLAQSSFILPSHIARLLGNRFVTNPDDVQRGDILIKPILDDRMQVMCRISDENEFAKLRVYDKSTQTYKYEKSELWHELIFIDKLDGCTCKSEKMLPKLLATATYDRWVDTTYEGKYVGHIFGVTRYSFIMLGQKNWFNDNVIHYHLTNQYFQLVLLSLVQRGSLLSFSAEVSKLALALKGKHGATSALIKQANDLHLNYLVFINRIYFREVTPQEQGIELYDLIQDKMGIAKEAASLKAEIQELNELIRNTEAQNLNRVASWFLPASFIAALFGVSFIDGNTSFSEPLNENIWMCWLIIFSLGGVTAYHFNRTKLFK
jgi:hypothetical protein